MTIEPRESVAPLSAYQPVEQEGLNLSDNSNLFEPNPAIERALSRVTSDQVRGYPTGYSDAVCQAIAERHDHPADGVVTANGSSDLIDLLIRTFADPGDAVAFHPPSFSMIPLWTRCNAAEPLPVPLGDGFQLDVEAYGAADAALGFICRPNNPTGNAFPMEDVRAIAEAFDGLLVLDEAYVSFTQRPSARNLVAEHDDVVLLRSLSKDAGLAGIRFGYALMPPDLAEEVRKVRGPFRVPRLTEEIALEALEDMSHVETLAKVVAAERQRVTDRVDELGLNPFPTETNFLLIETPWPGERLQSALADQGVLVRGFSSEALEACIRVTIGPPATNDTFLAALETVLEDGGP